MADPLLCFERCGAIKNFPCDAQVPVKECIQRTPSLINMAVGRNGALARLAVLVAERFYRSDMAVSAGGRDLQKDSVFGLSVVRGYQQTAQVNITVRIFCWL
jgi:hypothetical protein